MPYKERKRFSSKTKEAEFRLRIDYDSFKNADDKGKEKLILDNIIKSIRLLGEKVKNGFDCKKLEKDIRDVFDYH